MTQIVQTLIHEYSEFFYKLLRVYIQTYSHEDPEMFSIYPIDVWIRADDPNLSLWLMFLLKVLSEFWYSVIRISSKLDQSSIKGCSEFVYGRSEF